MVPDKTGRFAERPYYSEEELDRECEGIVAPFLHRRRKRVEFPMLTDDLHVLVEDCGAELDSYADLSAYGADVEGMTEFFPDRPPRVSISEVLANDDRRENRLRTTLAHEIGHVHFHRHLWAMKFDGLSLFNRSGPEDKIICKRDKILNASVQDWMEWQAGYVSGAIMMPLTRIQSVVTEILARRGLHVAPHHGSEDGREMVSAVMDQFAVSEEAARIRLLKLNLLTWTDRQLALFG